MKKDWLNHKLEKKLQNYSSAMDSEQAWERLAARRQNQQRKKKRFFFFWLSGLLLLILSAGYWSIKNTTDKQYLDPNSFPEVPATEKQRIVNTESNSSENNNESTLSQKNNTTQELIIPQSISNSISNQVPNNTNLPEFIENKQVETGRSSQTPATPQSEQINKLTSTSKTQAKQKSKALGLVDQLDLLDYQLLASPEKEIAPPLLPKSKPVKTKKWMIGLIGGYAKSWLNWEGESMQQEYLNRRSSAEEGLDSWTINLQVQRHLGKNWFVESGLSWQTSTSRFQDQYQIDSIGVAAVPAIQIIERLSGRRDSIPGNGPIRYTETGSLVVYNQHQQLSVPLYLGYRFPLSDQLSMSLAAGPVITFHQKASGYTFADADSDGSFLKLQELSYRQFGIWQIDTRIGLDYHLNERWSIQGGVRGSWQWGDIFENEVGYQEKRQQLGAYLGLGFFL